MSTSTAPTGPVPTPTTTAQATPEQLSTAFDNSIWYLLSLWHPLHVAVTNAWGGPTSDDKRDWFAGAISDLLTTSPSTDAEELECVMLQIMQDEFDCNVEDESETAIARDILAVKKRLLEERTLQAAREVEARWRARGQMKGSVALVEVNQDAEDADGTEWNGFEEEDEDEEMGGVPLLVPAAAPKEKVEPEVDDDGFIKVQSKKKR